MIKVSRPHLRTRQKSSSRAIPQTPTSSQAPLFTRTSGVDRTWRGTFTSIVTRFSGFAGRFEKAIEPLMAARTVGEMKQYFRTLPHVVGLARMRPAHAFAALSHAANSPNALYAYLTAVACGNAGMLSKAVAALEKLTGNHALALECIRMMMPFCPDEAHLLLQALFANEYMDTATRLELFRGLMMSAEFRKEALPKSFETMMRDSTPDELNLLVYPSVLDLLKKWKPCSSRLNLNREITKEMMRGWIASCEVITDHNHRRAQDVLTIPPSARG